VKVWYVLSIIMMICSDFGIARFKDEKTMTSVGTVPWTGHFNIVE
jgi:hypothetical protein